MAKSRLIPKLQLYPSAITPGSLSLVNTFNFSNLVEIGNPVSQAKIYEAQLADELILVDLSPSKGKTESDSNQLLETLKAVSREVFLPLTIGGGVKNIADVAEFLSHGADKVCMNSSVIKRPNLISEVAQAFGSQCAVVSIDYKLNAEGCLEVYSNGGQTPTGLDPISWAKKAEDFGAGEIMLTCIDNDGVQEGLDVSTGKLVAEELKIPLIISGGCGLASHFVDGFTIARADAVAAGTFFSFRDQNPMQTRGHIKNAGVNIRTGN
jgi:imidazole glycerol-phosphate synthase subunit HisF